MAWGGFYAPYQDHEAHRLKVSDPVHARWF